MLIVTAPYIDFRLHRTRSYDVEVQNRYLEQVVVGTGNLSAPRFRNSSRGRTNLSLDVTPLMPGNGSNWHWTKLAAPSVCMKASHAGEQAAKWPNSQPNTFWASL
jgi:hypothetical protein